MHVRTQISYRFTELITGLPTTGSSVYKSRLYPLQNDDLPGLCIFARSENIDEEEGKIDRLQHRDVFVVVNAKDKIEAGLDDNLDQIAAEVETAVFTDPFLSGLAMSIDLISTEIETSVEQEQPVGDMIMLFKVTYFTNEGFIKRELKF